MNRADSIAKKESLYCNLAMTGLLAVIFFYLIKSIGFPPHDFSNYYFAGKFFIEGSFDQSIYDPTTFNEKLVEDGYSGYFVNFAPNSPFIAIFFAPLSYLEIGTAKLVFNIINGFVFLFSFVRIIKYLKISDEPALLLLPLICFIPIRNGILFGQFYMLLFSFLTEGYLLYRKGKFVSAMFLWTIPAALKVAPGILVLYLIKKRDFKSLAIYSSIGALLLVSTGFLLGFDIFSFYLTYISPKVSFGEIVSAGFLPNQSPLMFFKFLFVSDLAENEHLLVDSNFLFAISMGITYALILYFALKNSKYENKETDFRTFGLWLLLIFLISPYGSSYSRILLVITYLSVVQFDHFRKKILIGSLLVFIVNFPYSRLTNWPVTFQFIGLFLMVLVLAAIIQERGIERKYWIHLSVSIFFLSFYFYRIVNKRKDIGQYLLNENPSLILNYRLTNGHIIYEHWRGNKESDSIDISGNELIEAQVFLKNNQIYLGDELVTDSPDNKKNPKLMDGNKVVYLSDWGRGYGFYTLRAIQLQNEYAIK